MANDGAVGICRMLSSTITEDAVENISAQQVVGNMYNQQAPTHGLPGEGFGTYLDYPFPITSVTDYDLFLSLAIEDLCPTFEGDIPSGQPGAP